MELLSNRARATLGTFGASTAVLAWASLSAQAGVIPNLELHVTETTTGYNQTFNPSGTSGPLFYNYGVNVGNNDFSINGDINGSPDIDGPSPALLNTTLSFTNTSSSTLNFIVTMTLPMTTNIPVSWNTSSSWVLTGPSSGVELQTLPGMPLWATFIDGIEIASLYDDPSGMGGGGGGPFNLNTDPKSGMFGPVTESIGIQLAFSLSPDATGGPTGGFTLVPAPGAIVVLAAGMFIGVPRRRRS